MTEGYEDMVFEVIESVNNEPVGNFEVFWGLMEKIEEGAAVSFQLHSGKEIVYFADSVEQERIMHGHGIASSGEIQRKAERTAVTLQPFIAPLMLSGIPSSAIDGGVKRPRTSSFKECR